MADKKPKLTQDIPLPPGVVVTPDYVVPAQPDKHVTASDRRVFADGTVEEKDHLSTYTTAPAPATKADKA